VLTLEKASAPLDAALTLLDYMGECNLEGRRTDQNERSNERSKEWNEHSKEDSKERNEHSNERSNKRTKRASK
jgi:hypothetical protein